ncbi:MAG: glycosyltransferase [Candidatus Kapabacteria bacterium]|nr:glycosyltransferase [Candidatus Kapabacteria bacterium]
MFPKSHLFARYNLTYLPVDETYEVDALIGAFMMARTDVVRDQAGFDPAFFMYGEDVDLCYRIQRSGWKVMYVHTTSIIHYKGESTKRSSINEVRVFYDAMEIFARKHFGGSVLFLAFLRIGIVLRALLARMMRRRTEVVMWMLDMISINLALMVATAVRFDGLFGFPAYAYPIVPIVVTIVATVSLVAVGEYVEYRPTIRRSVVGLLVTFFLLSSLTYFFKEYAFSRGVVLMTIGFSAALFTITRGLLSSLDSHRGVRKRRIILVGLNDHTASIIEELQRAEHRHTEIVGVVATSPFAVDRFCGVPVVGDTSYLARILDVTGAQEVVLTDPDVSHEHAMELMIASSTHRARFHMASEYDDIVTARIINDVAGVEPTVTIPPLMLFRNRVAKRTGDILAALVVLTLGLPFLALLTPRDRVRLWADVFLGRRSVVGLYPDGERRSSGKVGITGLVMISDPRGLSAQTIHHLNDYYVNSYSIALDIEIFLKHLLRRNRG